MIKSIKNKAPGIFLCFCITIIAYYAAKNIGIVTTFYSLLIGFMLNVPIKKAPPFKEGIDFTATKIMRFGFVLIGTQITLAEIIDIGMLPILICATGVVLNFYFSLGLGKFLRINYYKRVIAGSAVSICGASAAMVTSSFLPNYKNKNNDTAYVISLVTIIGCIVMILFPFITQYLNLNDYTSGIFLGASIHDIAQATMAGFAVSDTSGEVAAYTKFIRVLTLFPLIYSIYYYLYVKRKNRVSKTVTVSKAPFYIFIFVGFILLRSFNLIPLNIVELSGFISKFCLTAAIGAHALRVPFNYFKRSNSPTAILVIASTLFISSYTLFFITFFQDL